MRRRILAVPVAVLAAVVPAIPAHAAEKADCTWQIADVGTPEERPGRVIDLNNHGQAVTSWASGNEGSASYFWDGKTLQDIGSLGGDYTDALGLTDSGYVFGTSAVSGYAGHPFLWQRGVLTDLTDATPPGEPTPDPTRATPVAINEHGAVAGYYEDQDNGVVWENGSVTAVSGGGADSVRPRAINDAGQVAGTGYFSSGGSGTRAFVWRAGGYTDLGVLPGGYSSSVTDLNEKGDVVGWSDTGEFTSPHAVLWRDGQVTDLGTLDASLSSAVAVNDSGQVVGSLNINERAFFWSDGTMTDLGSLGGGWTEVVALNNRGQAVGSSTTETYQTHAFVAEDGHLTDLGAFPGGDSSYATNINDNGQIGGVASDATGRTHTVIWTPTC